MASNIKFKRSAVQNRVPTTAQLELGELALNTYDGKLYTEINTGSAAVVEIGSKLSSLVVDGDNGGGNGDVTFHGATANRDLLWDASLNILNFKDNTAAKFGNDWDLSIYHNNSIGIIANTTGALTLLSDTIVLNNEANNKAFIQATTSNVILFHDGNERLKTTADGVDISGTGSLKLPVGTTAQRSGSPTAGDMRYNSTTGSFEGYSASWGELGGGGVGIGSTHINPGSGVVGARIGVGFTDINFVGAGLSVTGYGSTVVVDISDAVSRRYGRNVYAYTATANQTTFTGLSYTNATKQISVYLNGAKLSAATYTATSGNTVVLDTGASVGDEIEILEIFSGVDLSRKLHSFTATAGQTTFTGLSYLKKKDLDVYLNGIRLAQSDYAAIDGGSIVLSVGASVNDLIEVVDMSAGATWTVGGTEPEDVYRLDGGVGIGTSNPTDKLNVIGNARIVGILTVGTGSVTIDNTTVKTGSTNVHNVGVELAGINVLGADTPIGVGVTIYNTGGALFAGTSGIVTATAFHGDGSQLSGIVSDKIFEGNTEVETIDTGTDGHVKFTTEGSERLRITHEGRVGINRTAPRTLLDLGLGSDAASISNTAADYQLGLHAAQSSSGDIGRNIAFISESAGSPVCAAINSVDDGSSSAAALQFATGNSSSIAERLRIDSSGRLLVGSTSSRSAGDVGAQLQLEGTSYHTSSLALIANSGASAGNNSHLTLAKSRGSSDGSNTILADGDSIGIIQWAASDGTDLNSIAANIRAKVDGTPGSNDMPGSLEFGTTADGSAAPTPRLTITSAGRWIQGASENINMDNNASGQLTLSGQGYKSGFAMNADGLQIYHNAIGKDIIFGPNETEKMRLYSNGNLNISANFTAGGTIKSTGNSYYGSSRILLSGGAGSDTTIWSGGTAYSDFKFNTMQSGLTRTIATLDQDGCLNLNRSDGGIVVAGISTLSGNTNVGGNLVVTGNLQVDGTNTIVNSTTMTVDDKNIVLGSGAANDAAADGGGITLESGDGNKTWNWVDATDAWTSSEHIHLGGDNKKLLLGASSDLELFHNGSHNIIKSVNGNLYLQDDSYIEIGHPNGTVAAGFIPTGAVNLRHNGSTKFETSSNGSKFYGHLIGQTAGSYIQVAGANSNAFAIGMTSGSDSPAGSENHLQFHHWNNSSWDKVFFVHRDYINLPDNKKLSVGDGGDLAIYHDGSNNSIKSTNGHINVFLPDGKSFSVGNSDFSEDIFRATQGGACTLWHNSGQKLTTTSSGVSITGNADISGYVSVGGNDSHFSENNLRFKPAGHAYIDHNTTSQSIYFRVSNSSSLDTNALILAPSGNATFSGSVTATGGFSGSGANLTGVNASTVFGLLASQFLRSDANDDFSGQLTSTYGNDEKIVLSGSSNPYIRFKEGTTNKAYVQWHQDGYLRIVNQEDNSIFGVRDNLVFSQDGGSSYLSVWNGGNDGSGSGLDADTCDGQHLGTSAAVQFGSVKTGGNAFKIDSYNTNDLRIQGTGATGAQGILGTDSAGNFQYQLYGTGTHVGFLDAAWGSWDIKKAIGGQMQIDISGSLYTVWNQQNDGSGSGLDADTCDGQHLGTGSSPTFANVYCNDWFRSNAAGEGLYNQANDAHFYSAGNNYWHINSNSGDENHGALILYDRHNSSQGAATGRKGYLYWDANGFGLLHSGGGWAVKTTSSATTLSGTLTHDGSTIWHAGNDGAGSGLDADSVDGVGVANLLRKDTTNTVSTYSNFTRWYSNSSITSTSGTQASLECYNSTAGNDAFMAFHVGGDYACYFGLDGGTNALSVGGWSMGGNSYKIWHQGTDGSGSGLDADTVDSIQAASFLRSDTTDSFSGNITFSSYLISNARDKGVFGVYDSTKTDHIWSMGTAYRNHSSGTNFGNLYGLAYKHTNNSSGGTMGGGHQMVWCTNGSPRGAIGNDNVWTVGDFRATSSNHIVMHKGNDGPASGFDADTLDTYQATSFIRTGHNTNYMIKFGSGTNTGHTRTSHAYAIFQEGGGWSTPYPDLCISYHTGIKIGCGHQSYGGLRFTPDYNSETILMSINNGTETNGNGNVKINTKLYINNQIDSSSIIRTDHTFYNDTSGDGTYSSATGMYWYSDGSNVMNIAGGTSANWIRFRDEDGGTIRGYIGANNSSSIGVLGHDGNWAMSWSAWANYSYKGLNPSPDNTYDLGKSDRRWDDIYATNSSIQTSDRNEKTTIVDSDLGLSFVNKLKPISYKWKGKTRTHYGFIAQDIETVITDLGKTTTQFAGLIKADISESEDGSEYRYGLRYSELISPVVKSIQELSDKVTELATKVAALESA